VECQRHRATVAILRRILSDLAPATWLAGGGPVGSFSTGDGSTTFRIPDLRGEFLRAWDDGRGVDTARAIGTWQADRLRSHTHEIEVNSTSAAGPRLATGTGASGAGTIPTVAAGGAETNPRNVALLACIRF
jgi:phage-related tail fiber protein